MRPDDADHFLAEIEEAMREKQRKSSPSPTFVPYCDEHLGVKMMMSILGEFGSTQRLQRTSIVSAFGDVPSRDATTATTR